MRTNSYPWPVTQLLQAQLWLYRGAKATLNATSLVRRTQAARHPHMHEALYTHKVRCTVCSNTILSKLCHKLLADVICSKWIKSMWWHRFFALLTQAHAHSPNITQTCTQAPPSFLSLPVREKNVPPWSSNTRESSQYSSTKRWSYYMYFIAVLGWE